MQISTGAVSILQFTTRILLYTPTRPPKPHVHVHTYYRSHRDRAVMHRVCTLFSERTRRFCASLRVVTLSKPVPYNGRVLRGGTTFRRCVAWYLAEQSIWLIWVCGCVGVWVCGWPSGETGRILKNTQRYAAETPGQTPANTIRTDGSADLPAPSVIRRGCGGLGVPVISGHNIIILVSWL